MDNDEYKALLGQLIADQLVRDALLIALMEVIPDLHARLEAKVAVMAPGALSRLSEPTKSACQERLRDVRELLSNSSR